jgi:hypothetical protein
MWNKLLVHLTVNSVVLVAAAFAIADNNRPDAQTVIRSDRFEIAQGTAAPAGRPQPPVVQEAWQKVRAFGVELEVPARWRRIEIRKPSSDHDETEFAENPRNLAAGAWFSVFPNSDELIDPERQEQPIVLDGRPALLTDFLTRDDDPPPRRRQIIIYLADKVGPAFLFDGDENKWSVLGPILAHIQESIRLPQK